MRCRPAPCRYSESCKVARRPLSPRRRPGSPVESVVLIFALGVVVLLGGRVVQRLTRRLRSLS